MNSASEVITVSELNRKARLAIEKSLPSCWVGGEISNFTQASSGHWYFTLKDAQSSVKCAFFRNRNQFTDWRPSEGNKIEVRAQATLYEPRGDYQLVVDAIRRAGQGNLFEEFLRLKAKLEAEGLFQSEQKRPLPAFPKTIGIVTSLQAAALQDALRTLHNRWPFVQVIIFPCTVQGIDAAKSIMDALDAALKTDQCDVLLLIRGGGSLEDLNAYNDEGLARAIRASTIPIIAGIGHETDFSIADFVADLRAATPTAAAQFAVPDQAETNTQITQLQLRAARTMQNRLNQNMQYLDGFNRRLQHPGEKIQHASQKIHLLSRRLTLNERYRLQRHHDALLLGSTRLVANRPDFETLKTECRQLMLDMTTRFSGRIAHNRNRLNVAVNSLQQLNPENILARGYCIVQDSHGAVLKSVNSVQSGNALKITLNTGQLEAKVTRVAERAS
jgi:exodeoxyribonuclease VII large subunit